MRYSAFEQAAAEASLGLKEVDIQMEQLKTQIEQLQSKRDLLQSLSSQLSALRGDGKGTASTETPKPSFIETAKPELPRPESEAEVAGAARSLRQEWGSLGSDAGPGDSSIRGRL